MDYKIYIQAMNNFPIADWAVSAYMGFREKQANIIFFEDIEEVPVSRYGIILVAFIEDTNKYLEKLLFPPKLALNIPKELLTYAGREIRYMTLSEFKKDSVLPVFVKSNGRSKEFGAGVISKAESKELFFNDIPDNAPLLVSEVVDFISEYRCYVINGELKGIKHYLGDFRVFPNPKVIDAAINDYSSQPSGYAIDFGVTSDGRTLLVECNDGWSLGNYGLNDVTYSTLLATRWRQLMEQEILIPIDKLVNSSIEEIDSQMKIRRNLINQMVGTVYPEILEQEIHTLMWLNENKIKNENIN